MKPHVNDSDSKVPCFRFPLHPQSQSRFSFGFNIIHICPSVVLHVEPWCVMLFCPGTSALCRCGRVRGTRTTGTTCTPGSRTVPCVSSTRETRLRMCSSSTQRAPAGVPWWRCSTSAVTRTPPSGQCRNYVSLGFSDGRSAKNIKNLKCVTFKSGLVLEQQASETSATFSSLLLHPHWKTLEM